MNDNESWNFGDLDLSDSEVDSGEQRLQPGRYICEVVHAELKSVKTDARAKRLEVGFVDVSGLGSIRESINIHLPKSEEATQIGKKQLITLLTHGGHPTPERPGDIKSLVGLTVGVNVSIDKYQDKKGEMRDGAAIDSWHPYFNPEGATNLGPKPKANGAASSSVPPTEAVQQSAFDDIPF